MKYVLYFLAIGIFFIQGCSSDDDTPPTVCTPIPAEDQEDIINEALDQSGWTMETSSTGLRYSIETPGVGDNIMFGNTIEINYQGTLLNGTVFDAGTIGPVVFQQGAFIPGFEEGLLLLNEGSEGLFILPGEIAYGCFPPPGSIIGENEVLIFEVTVLSVTP